jgi:hypothetical protein
MSLSSESKAEEIGSFVSLDDNSTEVCCLCDCSPEFTDGNSHDREQGEPKESEESINLRGANDIDEENADASGSDLFKLSGFGREKEKENQRMDEQKEQAADGVENEVGMAHESREWQMNKREARTDYCRRKFVEDGQISTALKAGKVEVKCNRFWFVSSVKTISGPISFSRFKGRRGWSMSVVVTFESGSKLEGIEKSAFEYSRLKSIVIPSSVIVLRKSSFAWCKLLESVTFESGSRLKRIEKSTFSSSGLKSIEIPSSVIVLNESIFRKCNLLESVTFENGSKLERIQERAFLKSSLRSIIIPSSVIVLSESSFALCKSLKAVMFESGLRLGRIEKSAFSASGLKSIVIPSSVIVLSESSFALCESLKSVIFEDGSRLERIEKSAFWRSGLKSIVIPPSNPFIADSAFPSTRLTFAVS